MINKFFVLNKKPTFLFLLMLGLELAMIFALSQKNGIEIFFRGDGLDYQNLAKNLIYHQTLIITPTPPYLPTNFRTPIYPFWLALIYLIFKSFIPAIFIGAAIFALSAPLVYLIGREIFSEKIAFISAIIFSLEPWIIYQAGFLAAEQIFLPIFLLSIYLFLFYIKFKNTHYLYWTFLILGIAALTRPVAIAFTAIFVLLSFIIELKASIWQAIKISFLTLLIFIMTLSPWFIRNKIVLNSWQFSSDSGMHVFGDYVMLKIYLGKTKPDEVVDIYKESRRLLGVKNDWDAMSVENSSRMSQVALREIKSNFGSFLKMYSQNILLFFFKNSYGNIFFDFGIPDSNIQSKIINNFKQTKDFSAVSLIREASFGAKILLFWVLFWPIITLLAIFGAFKIFLKRWKDPLLWLLILWVLYFSVLTASGRDISRYRLAVHAPLFMLAVVGFYKIKSFLTFNHKSDYNVH